MSMNVSFMMLPAVTPVLTPQKDSFVPVLLVKCWMWTKLTAKVTFSLSKHYVTAINRIIKIILKGLMFHLFLKMIC